MKKIIISAIIALTSTIANAGEVCRVNETDIITFDNGWAVYEFMGPSKMETHHFSHIDGLGGSMYVMAPAGHAARHMLKRIVFGSETAVIRTVVNTDLDYYYQQVMPCIGGAS